MQRRHITSCVGPVDDVDEEELCAGPEGVLLVDGGGACLLLSRLEVTDEVGGGAAGRVEVDYARGVHDEGRPAE